MTTSFQTPAHAPSQSSVTQHLEERAICPLLHTGAHRCPSFRSVTVIARWERRSLTPRKHSQFCSLGSLPQMTFLELNCKRQLFIQKSSEVQTSALTRVLQDWDCLKQWIFSEPDETLSRLPPWAQVVEMKGSSNGALLLCRANYRIGSCSIALFADVGN